MPAAAKKKAKPDEEQGPTLGVYMFPNGDKYEITNVRDKEHEVDGVAKALVPQKLSAFIPIKCMADGNCRFNALSYHVKEGEYILNNDGTGERSGEGTHTTAGGVVYRGQWTGDKMNGQGTIEFPSGCRYEGEFVNNMFQGIGRYTWPNGSFYEGEFSGNKMQGTGEFTDTDGQIWTGNFLYKAAPGLRFKVNLEV